MAKRLCNKQLNKNSLMQKYIIKQKIGVGSFGEVFLVQDKKCSQRLAMKKMKEHFGSEQEVKELMQVKILSRLRHPNIIDFRESIYDKVSQEGNLIFEYCQSDICKKFCYNNKQRPPESQIKKHIFEIASALAYAHGKNYIHRDIKPENILIQKNEFEGRVVEVAKLSDFGISKKADELPLTDYVGTRWYRAPELLIKMKNYSQNVDVFSLGCIMAEFYNMEILFNGKNSNDQLVLMMKKLGTPTKQSWPEFSNWCKLKGITYGKYLKSEDPIIFKAKQDDLAQDLIQKMLLMNPKNRISSTDILKHPYFNDVRPQLLARQYAAKPVKQVQQQEGLNSDSKCSNSQNQIKTSSNTAQKAQIETHHSTDQKEGEESARKEADEKLQKLKQSKQTDEKISKLKQSKQTESSKVVKEVKEVRDISRPPVSNRPGQQRVKAKSPAFYSPYASQGGKEGKSRDKKFDYYQTYVLGKTSQSRVQSKGEAGNQNKFSSSSHYHAESSERV